LIDRKLNGDNTAKYAKNIIERMPFVGEMLPVDNWLLLVVFVLNNSPSLPLFKNNFLIPVVLITSIL
jgi:hypothetical protein